MPITVTCQCGKSFQAKDELAGRTMQCPSCGAGLHIPGGGNMGDLLTEAGLETRTGDSCPNCNAELPENAVLCVQCGYNIQTGQRMQTLTATGERVGMSETEKMLYKAATDLEKEPVRHDEGYGSMGGAWLTLAIMAVGLVIGLGLMFAAFKWIDAGGNTRATQVMFVIGWLMSVIGNIWILTIAFKESVLQGVLCIVIPLYIFLYMIVNFDDCVVPTILSVVGMVMLGVSYIMAAFGGDASGVTMLM